MAPIAALRGARGLRRCFRVGSDAVMWGAFRLEPREQKLVKDGREVHLRGKPFSILQYLALRPRRLVTRSELVDAVWGRIAMSESVLRTHLWELRRVVGDGVVETVARRGYRFIAAIASPAPAGRSTTTIVGRGHELAVLRDAFGEAAAAARSVVFVSGEPGAGKSWLVDAFLDEARADPTVRIARGVCSERATAEEPFQPVLEALGTLCRGPLGELAVRVLARYAPTVVAQMPALRQARGPGDAAPVPARMLRELAEAIEAIGSEAPLVLAIDDLQWADPATLDLVAALGRRRERSHLLVVTVARTSTCGPRLDRIVAELVAHRRAVSIALGAWDERAVAEYQRVLDAQRGSRTLKVV